MNPEIEERNGRIFECKSQVISPIKAEEIVVYRPRRNKLTKNERYRD